MNAPKHPCATSSDPWDTSHHWSVDDKDEFLREHTCRILVTGSRDWPHVAAEAIRDALHEVWVEYDNYLGLVVVSGACPSGADKIAEDYWTSLGLPVERHPAQWRRSGYFDPSEGPLRNQEMVDAGADMCVAFIKDDSPGATGTVRKARDAGIPVRLFELGKHADEDNIAYRGTTPGYDLVTFPGPTPQERDELLQELL